MPRLLLRPAPSPVNAGDHALVNGNVASKQHNKALMFLLWPNSGVRLFSDMGKVGIRIQ
jgi:hypothetical protein